MDVETVLVVENGASLRKLTASILSRQGFRVITAQNALEALELCRQERDAIDLVLSDLVPQISCQELAAEIRRHYPEVKLAFMSGYAEHRIIGAPSFAHSACLGNPSA